jgi:mono/diheme cytochrome c family protein
MGYLSTLTTADQQAIVTALTPATPAPAPTPTPTPAPDGASLYSSNCAGCHGVLASSGKAGATASRIQTAITGNVGGMGYLSTLASADVNAIATALAGVTPSPTPAPAPACGSCHAIPPATGRHAKHLSKGISCAVCHGSGYGTTTVNAATHNNGVKNVASTTGWNATARSCANSCHGTERW